MPGEQKNLGMICGDFLASILELATANFNFIMHRKDLLKTSRSFLCHYAISTPRQPVCRKRRCHTSGFSQCLMPSGRGYRTHPSGGPRTDDGSASSCP